jgi:hypothetical protein
VSRTIANGSYVPLQGTNKYGSAVRECHGDGGVFIAEILWSDANKVVGLFGEQKVISMGINFDAGCWHAQTEELFWFVGVLTATS